MKYKKLTKTKKLKLKAITWMVNKMPKWLVYYCTIRLWSHSFGNDYPMTWADKITVDEALGRWLDKRSS